MHEILRELRVGEGTVEPRERVTELDVEVPGTARDGERPVAIDRLLVDEPVRVREAAPREILSRAGAGRSAVGVVEDHDGNEMVELRGFEPMTPRLPALCSPN